MPHLMSTNRPCAPLGGVGCFRTITEKHFNEFRLNKRPDWRKPIYVAQQHIRSIGVYLTCDFFTNEGTIFYLRGLKFCQCYREG